MAVIILIGTIALLPSACDEEGASAVGPDLPPGSAFGPSVEPAAAPICPGITLTSAKEAAPGVVPSSVRPPSILVPCPGYDIVFVEDAETGDRLVVMFPDGSSTSVVYSGDSSLSGPNWSPDGTSIVFAEILPDRPLTYRLDRIDITWDNTSETFGGANFTVLARDGFSPAWSPLGNEIAFSTSEGNLALVPALGGQAQILYRPPSGYWSLSPAWSPDGARIAFVETEAGGYYNNSALRLLDRASGKVTRTLLPSMIGAIGGLDWARGGSDLLAFHNRPEFDWSSSSLYVLNLTDGTLVRVTAGVGPSWSPDNTKILYAYWSGGREWQVRIIELASGSIQTLVRGAGSPDWNWFGSAAAADVTAPAAVTDMAVDQTLTTQSSVDLGWTATGDDGFVGSAYMYDVRYLPNEEITAENWNWAIQASDEPVPQLAGSQEHFTVLGLEPNTTYSFALRAIDEWSNPSPLSNVGTEITHPPLAATWIAETVDPERWTGWWASVAIDSSGNPHIAYMDSTGALYYADVKYARWTGSSWDIQTVPDPSPNVGRWTSIAVDRAGLPRIIYYDDYNYRLKYARWDGASWSIETVDGKYGGPAGNWNSIVLDGNDNPHISYRKGWDVSAGGLIYARWTGTEWIKELVDRTNKAGLWGTSIDLTAAGQPRIAYHAGWLSRGGGELRYAQRTGTGWAIETVDSLPNGDTGQWASLKLDGSGNPHISYEDGASLDLKYGRWTGSSWAIEVVDRAGDVGGDTSLALDGEGRTHISYFDWTNKRTKYAAWIGSSWTVEFVDDRVESDWMTSLALRPDGRPVVAYSDATLHRLRLARRTEAPAPLYVTTGIDLQPSRGVPGEILLDGVPMDESGTSWVTIRRGPHLVSFADVSRLETPVDVAIVAEPGRTAHVRRVYNLPSSSAAEAARTRSSRLS